MEGSVNYIADIWQLLIGGIVSGSGIFVASIKSRKRREVELKALKDANLQLQTQIQSILIENEGSEVGVIDQKLDLYQKLIDDIDERYQKRIEDMLTEYEAKLEKERAEFKREIENIKRDLGKQIDYWKEKYHSTQEDS